MNIIGLLLLLIIGIIIVSLPIYVAAKLVSRKATFGRAVIAAILGPVVFYVFLLVFGTITALVFAFLLPIVFLLALVFLVYFYSVIFETSFLGGLLIAIIAVIVTVILFVVLSAISLFAFSLPGHQGMPTLSILNSVLLLR